MFNGSISSFYFSGRGYPSLYQPVYFFPYADPRTIYLPSASVTERYSSLHKPLYFFPYAIPKKIYPPSASASKDISPCINQCTSFPMPVQEGYVFLLLRRPKISIPAYDSVLLSLHQSNKYLSVRQFLYVYHPKHDIFVKIRGSSVLIRVCSSRPSQSSEVCM